mgnify:CR=1 FL=1
MQQSYRVWKGPSWDGLFVAKFYFDGHIRYRKTKDIMMTGVQNIVTSKHATYLEFPPPGFEPEFSF